MRVPFQLCSKVLGLLLVTAAIVAALTWLPLCILYITLLPPTGPSVALILLQYVLAALVPAAFGLYLTRSENAFVRLCYPAPAGTPAAGPAAAPEDEAGGGGAGDDRRYAPPGYQG